MTTGSDSIQLRLTRSQVSFIWPGIDFVAKSYSSHRDKKKSLYCYPFRLRPPAPGFDKGRFDPELMNMVMNLWKRLRKKANKGGRFQFNSIEIRIAIFAVRVNGDWMRRQKYDGRKLNQKAKKLLGIDAESLKKLKEGSARVIRTLERHMKRADYKLLSLIPRNQHNLLVRAWKAHLRWMRLCLAYFKPLLPILLVGRKTANQRVLDELEGIAASGIREAGYRVPEQPELRRLMRLYARSLRRGREGIGIRYILTHANGSGTKRLLYSFVDRRIELKER